MRALACVVAAAFVFAPQSRPRQQPAPRSELEQVERRLFDSVNSERRKSGVAPLIWNEVLAAAAREHALNMVGRRFFSHADPILGDLAARLKRRGIRWEMCAENLFQEQGYKDPVPEAVRGWMASSSHRANILNPRFTQTGLGMAFAADGALYFDQIFIRQRESPPSGRVGS